jgi:hypothetical protein
MNETVDSNRGGVTHSDHNDIVVGEIPPEGHRERTRSPHRLHCPGRRFLASPARASARALGVGVHQRSVAWSRVSSLDNSADRTCCWGAGSAVAGEDSDRGATACGPLLRSLGGSLPIHELKDVLAEKKQPSLLKRAAETAHERRGTPSKRPSERPVSRKPGESAGSLLRAAAHETPRSLHRHGRSVAFAANPRMIDKQRGYERAGNGQPSYG